jgi:hypothetical protein
MALVQTLTGFNRNQVVFLKQIAADPLLQLKKFDGTHTGVGASIDQNGLPVTGLTEDREIPSKSGKSTITVPGTRRVLEKELSLPEGMLKQQSDYWSSYFVKVGAEDVKLDLTNPYDLQKYLFCKAQTNVADGMKEVGDRSGLEFVMYSKKQEATDKIEKRSYIKKAYALAGQLDQATMIDILSVYGEQVDSTEPNVIIARIDDRIEENPKGFLEIAEGGFLVQHSLIAKCLDAGALLKKDGAIMHGEVPLGLTPDLAAEALAKNEKLQILLKAKVSGNAELIAELSKETK